VILFLNLIVVVVESLHTKTSDDAVTRTCQWVELIFTVIYTCEMIAKLSLQGWRLFWASMRNRYDFLVTLALVLITIVWLCDPHSTITGEWLRYCLILRVLKLLVLLAFFPRFRVIATTFGHLVSRSVAVAGMLFVLLFVNATFMVQVWGGMINRENMKLVNDTAYPQSEMDDYFLNNANDMLSAMVTLFELLVINNWFEVAEGFVTASQAPAWLVKLFFVQFHVISTMIVLNLVITFVIDAYDAAIEQTDEEQSRAKDIQRRFNAEHDDLVGEDGLVRINTSTGWGKVQVQVEHRINNFTMALHQRLLTRLSSDLTEPPSPSPPAALVRTVSSPNVLVRQPPSRQQAQRSSSTSVLQGAVRGHATRRVVDLVRKKREVTEVEVCTMRKKTRQLNGKKSNILMRRSGPPPRALASEQAVVGKAGLRRSYSAV